MYLTLEQTYGAYTREDHAVWSILFKRQNEVILNRASAEFQKGFQKLCLAPESIGNLEVLNERLRLISDWQLIGVPGIVPVKDFFLMLSEKKFPVTVFIRKPEAIEFSDFPDIFHDIYGHVPMLLNPLFCDFISEFSMIGLEYYENDEAIECLKRLYWFTMEVGVIAEDDQLNPYGGAIMTSSYEIENINKASTLKHPFDLLHVISTDYDSVTLQSRYFVIHSFQQLFDSLKEVKQYFQERFSVPKVSKAPKQNAM